MQRKSSAKKFIIATVIISGLIINGHAQSVSIATWRGNAKAAFTINADDYPFYQNYIPENRVKSHFREWGFPSLIERGLAMTFATCGKHCDADDWQALKDAIDNHGFEPINHGYDHYDNWELNTQVVEEHTGYKMAFSLGCQPSPGISDGYIGKRSGSFNSITEFNDKNIQDLFAVKSHYYQNNKNWVKDSFVVLCDALIAQEGWCFWQMHELHYYCCGGKHHMPLDDWYDLLDVLDEHQNKGDLWVGGPADITRYIKLRQNTQVSIVNQSGDNMEIKISIDGFDRTLYETTITFVVELPSTLNQPQAQQNGQVIDIAFNGANKIMFDASPYNGNINIDNNGSTKALPGQQFNRHTDKHINITGNIISLEGSGSYSLSIVNCTGNIVLKYHGDSDNSFNISDCNLPTGIYLLRLMNNGQKFIRRITVRN